MHKIAKEAENSALLRQLIKTQVKIFFLDSDLKDIQRKRELEAEVKKCFGPHRIKMCKTNKAEFVAGILRPPQMTDEILRKISMMLKTGKINDNLEKTLMLSFAESMKKFR